MYGYHSRAVRGTLGALLLALAACVDETTAPASLPQDQPQLTLADPFTVTNTDDSAIGSLRWVLSHTTGGETVRFDPSLGGRTIALDSTLRLANDVTIEGPANTGMVLTTAGKGPIFSGGADATIRNLSLTGGDGAIFAVGDWVVENSAIHGNHAAGGVNRPLDVISAATITLVNSTVSGNTTPANGYGVYGLGSVALINSTVANNTFGIAAVQSGGTSRVLRNSILAHNGARNCPNATMTREGANISDDDTCGGPTEIIIGDPRLGPFADNGGPTKTHALLAGSPAINAGTGCTVQVDQRYLPRDAQCDLGAFEFADFTTVQLTAASSGTFDANGFATLSGTVRCSRNETFELHVELHQNQKKGRDVIDVHAVSAIPIACTTNLQPWSVGLTTAAEPFQLGDAEATVSTLNAKKWVTPASLTQSVRLSKAKK